MKTLLLISFLFLAACGGLDVGNSSKNSEDDNSTNINDSFNELESSEKEKCPEAVLWKPISESDGNLVLLFPASFKKAFEAVFVYDLEGLVESGEFAGFTNGARQTWRFSKPGSEYDGEIEIETGEETCELSVKEPGERSE